MSKKKKYRGSGTHGGGSKKKRRGAGSRGGRGRAGDKHKKIKYWKEGSKKRKGFKRPEAVTTEQKTINIKELEMRLDEFLERGFAEEADGNIKLNLEEAGYDKLLGSGKARSPMVVKCKKFSEKAKEKLEEVGGSAIEIS